MTKKTRRRYSDEYKSEALIHGIGGRHGRQREIEPLGMPGRQQSLGEDAGRLGLAGPRDVFEDEQLRPRRDRQRLGLTLQGGRRDRPTIELGLEPAIGKRLRRSEEYTSE